MEGDGRAHEGFLFEKPSFPPPPFFSFSPFSRICLFLFFFGPFPSIIEFHPLSRGRELEKCSQSSKKCLSQKKQFLSLVLFHGASPFEGEKVGNVNKKKKKKSVT
jgi:hypothetical protein